jgi:hypothetical protein
MLQAEQRYQADVDERGGEQIHRTADVHGRVHPRLGRLGQVAEEDDEPGEKDEGRDEGANGVGQPGDPFGPVDRRKPVHGNPSQ